MKKIPLHDYQIKAKDFIKANPFCALYLDMGLGKAQDDNTIIPTPSGKFRRVGDMKVGDEIIGKDGKPTTILAVYPHKNKTAYEVTLKDGRKFICCDEHLIPFTSYTGAKKLQSKQLKDMLCDYKKTTSQGYTKYKYRIPVCDSVEYRESKHIISPYALGVLIGDGCLSSFCTLTISSSDADIIEKFANECNIDDKNIHKSNHNYNWSFTNDANADKVRTELKSLGLWGKTSREKFIPDEYMIDSIENRKSLLSGLLDTDGGIQCSRANGSGSMHYMLSTMSESVKENVLSLCYSLGYGTSVTKTYDDNEKTILHDIAISIYTNDELITCKRKLDAIKTAKRLYVNTWKDKFTPIVDISQVASRDMTCFTVSAQDHLYLINDYIVTHNTLTTLVALLEIKPSGHILVIAPKTIARATWLDEIHDWEIPVRTESLIVNDKGKQLSKAKRIEKYNAISSNNASMYFINRELLPDLIKYFTDNKIKWPFPTVVIDEMQGFKSSKSERFKALKKVRPNITSLIGLSGTPAPNGLLDLWSQIYLLDMGNRLGKSQTAYKDIFFDVARMYDGYAIEWSPKRKMPPMLFEDWLSTYYNLNMLAYRQLSYDQQMSINANYNNYIQSPCSAEDEIYKRIGDICMSMKNTSLAMPNLIFQDVFVTMDESEMALYKELKAKSVLDFADDTSAIAANAAVLSAKLLQLASGSLYTDDTTETNGYRSYQEIHTKKIEMCQYIVDNTNSPVLIAYHFKSDAKRLLESIDGAVLFNKTPQMIHDWNDGKIKVLLIQPASAGHGLNLQKGEGHTLVWFTIPWSLEEYQQTNARLYRQGQKNNVTIYRLFTKGTLDTHVANTIKGKAMTQTALLDAIEATLDDD